MKQKKQTFAIWAALWLIRATWYPSTAQFFSLIYYLFALWSSYIFHLNQNMQRSQRSAPWWFVGPQALDLNQNKYDPSVTYSCLLLLARLQLRCQYNCCRSVCSPRIRWCLADRRSPFQSNILALPWTRTKERKNEAGMWWYKLKGEGSEHNLFVLLWLRGVDGWTRGRYGRMKLIKNELVVVVIDLLTSRDYGRDETVFFLRLKLAA